MSIGTFTLIKNEARWIGPNIMRILPYVDEMVFFDGNSTDGTLEVIKYIRENNADGDKITLVEGKDPANLQDAYVEMFNDCMWTLKTVFAWFLHPDMWVENPQQIREVAKSQDVALYTHLKSYGGEPGGQLYEIIEGRGDRWKNIYRLRYPDLGAHYFGHYGAQNEDVYFSSVTGDSHEHFGGDFEKYPYPVADSGLRVQHYSDVRPLARRVERMERCLENQGYPQEVRLDVAKAHPRVTLKDGGGFKFKEVDWPAEFRRHDEVFSKIVEKATAHETL